MKNIKIVTVGSLSEPHWKAAAQHYEKRLRHTASLDLISVKDAPARLLPQAKAEHESERLLRQVHTTDILICLDDKGKAYSSEAFASLLEQHYNYGETPCFVIGGAYGLSAGIKSRARHLFSLSKLTFPHEMALVILLEQLYRAETILLGTGYHHG